MGGSGLTWSGLLQRLAGNATSLLVFPMIFRMETKHIGKPWSCRGLSANMALETRMPRPGPDAQRELLVFAGASHLPALVSAGARSAPNQQVGHPNGDERVYDWVWMVSVFLLGVLSWVNYVGANLRFTLYIYYRLGST